MDPVDHQQKELLWKKTGFFRPLGGFWYNYIFNLVLMIFGLLFLGVIFPNYILPFPEAMGFKSVVSSLFAMLFNVFDLGVGASVSRYMAEYVGKGQVKKAMEYLRFFIWFQMITGLIQITIIAIYTFEIGRYVTDLAPLLWLFLFNSLIQYPGMLGVYSGALEAFQRYDKKNIVAFLQQVVFEMTTQIVFIFIGRAFGRANPMLGELMGATLGYIIGLYLDDFMAMLLSAIFFRQILQPYKIPLWDSLVPVVSKEVIYQSLWYGIRNMLQNVFYQASMLLITAMTIWWLPSYASILGMFTIADTITRIVIQDLPMRSAVAEAYNCGKKHLTDYYIQAQFKWYGILTPYLALEILMLIPPVIGEVAGSYAGAAWMIPYLMLSRVLIGPIHFSDNVQQGADKPEYAAYSLLVQMLGRAVAFYILLSPYGFSQYFENYNLGIAYLVADFPSILAKNIFAWWLIDRKIIKVKINWWQTIITPVLAILPLIPINYIFIALFNAAADLGFIYAIGVALFLLVFILFLVPILVVFPMIGLLGGWDDRGLEHLYQASIISGPSRRLVLALYRGSLWGFQHSPFKSMARKWTIPHEDADREAEEINKARMACETP